MPHRSPAIGFRRLGNQLASQRGLHATLHSSTEASRMPGFGGQRSAQTASAALPIARGSNERAALDPTAKARGHLEMAEQLLARRPGARCVGREFQAEVL